MLRMGPSALVAVPRMRRDGTMTLVSAKGQLRVVLGAAPGVGKTYAMLSVGEHLVAEGADVVVGYADTHHRAVTEAKLRNLEQIPAKRVTYRGATFEELDTDAVIVRRPAVALVDELAHTNVPGGCHIKRWQDIEEILDAGIDVVTTVNVQHLNSLNDAVEALTGVAQHETVPDAVVSAATSVELIDVAPEELRSRLGAILGGRTGSVLRQARGSPGSCEWSEARGSCIRQRWSMTYLPLIFASNPSIRSARSLSPPAVCTSSRSRISRVSSYVC